MIAAARTTVDTFGPIDIACNAGVCRLAVEQMPDEMRDFHIDVNIQRRMEHLPGAVVPYMLENGGGTS